MTSHLASETTRSVAPRVPAERPLARMARLAAILGFGVAAGLGCASTSSSGSLSTSDLATSDLAGTELSRPEFVENQLAGQGGAADGTQDASDATAVAVPIPGSDNVHGLGTITVAAPIADVRKGVLDFKHYADFMPHYKTARVLGRTDSGARDVYMEVEALHGAVTMWVRLEVPKPTDVDGVETYETRFVEGNVKDFVAIWRLKRISKNETELSLELFCHPKIPVPSSLLNDENVSNAGEAVAAMRSWIEAGGAP